MNKVVKYPVISNLIVTLVVWLGTRYGLSISDGVATEISAGVFTVGSLIVHKYLATPVADPHDNDGNKLVPITDLSSAPKPASPRG